MSSMSIPSSIRAIKLPLSSSYSNSKPLFISSSIWFTSFKSITFQRLKTKTNPKPKPPQSSIQQPIEELPPKLQEIIKLFQAAQDPRSKYQQLLFYANNLPPLPDEFKTKDNKVEGCVSQVWVRAFLQDQDKLVFFQADSDSIMTKGLAALLVLGLSGRPVPDILRVSPDFITLLGLQHNLTPSRNNGFLNMFKLMQRKALLLGLEAENNQPKHDPSGSHSQSQLPSSDNIAFNTTESLNLEVGRSENENVVVDQPSSSLGRRGERIKDILETELKPLELELEDISYQHAGHVGVKGSDGETHFNLKIVSNEFEGKSLVKRHRMIYGLLQDELEEGLHALSIVAKTPAEVQEGR